MTRLRPILLVAVALLLPLGAPAQQDAPGFPEFDGSSGDGSAEAGGAEIFLGAFRAIRNFHADGFADSVLWEKALQGLIDELGDPYATVFTPDQFLRFQEDNTGNYAGIGVTISALNDRITVTAVFRGAPADIAGLQVGDRIVSVDGEDARGWTVEQASENIRGPAGSTVDLQVDREGSDQEIPIRVSRDNVHVPAVTAEVVHDSIGYMLLDRMARNSAEEVDSALNVLRGSKGIVFDLRRNPGGYLDEALDMADLFLEPGAVVASAQSRVPGDDGQMREERWESERRARLPDVPIVVLVDEYSASASEIVAGALQDHDRAVVLGARTFGKGVVQTVMRIPGDHRIRLTTGSWYTPLGRSLHRPRDQQGNLLPEDPDSFEAVLTESGRSLRAGGGVFPDLPIASDTLTTVEQNLVTAAAEARIQLRLRIAEFAFEQAARDGSGSEVESVTVDPAALDVFLAELVDDGLPPEVLEDPGARAYVDWRVRGAMADRMDLPVQTLEIRLERDPVLAEAVRLLEGSETQRDLFAAVQRRTETDGTETARAGPQAP